MPVNTHQIETPKGEGSYLMDTAIQIRSGGQILKAALTYFGLVFGTGFVLGAIRVLFIVPQLGERNAELLGQPLMLVVVFLTAKWVVARFGKGLTKIETLGIGLVALAILLLAEVLVALFLQPNQPRDAISASVYFGMLGAFAVMPWMLSRRRAP